MIGRDFFDRSSLEVAQALIGVKLLVDGVGGAIVETEAYAPDDPASHSFPGPTPRNAVMFGPPGHAYIYLSYGIHWMLNFVCSNASAVLIRAIVPETGIERMAERRGISTVRDLCRGPGRVGQALGVGSSHYGLPLDQPPFALMPGMGPAAAVVSGVRIGITKAVDQPWRFGLAGSPFLSRPIPPGSA